MHYPPETACVMLLARIVATVRQASDKEGAVALFLQFCHRTVNEAEEIAHKLLGEEFCDQLETLRALMDAALGAPDVRHASNGAAPVAVSANRERIRGVARNGLKGDREQQGE